MATKGQQKYAPPDWSMGDQMSWSGEPNYWVPQVISGPYNPHDLLAQGPGATAIPQRALNLPLDHHLVHQALLASAQRSNPMPTYTEDPGTVQTLAKKYGVSPSAIQFNPQTNTYSGSVQQPTNFWGHIGSALSHIPGLGGLKQQIGSKSPMAALKYGLLGGAEAGGATLLGGLGLGALGGGGAGAAGAEGLGLAGGFSPVAGGGAADLLGAQAAGGTEGGGMLNFLKNYVTGQPLSSGGGMGIKQMLKIGARVGIPAAAIYGLFGKKKPGDAASAAGGGPSGQNAQDLLGYAALASAFMNPYEQQIRQAYQTQASAIKRLIPQLPSQFRGVAGLMQADMASQAQMLPGLLGQQAAGLPMELLNAAQSNPLGGLPAGSTGTVNIPGMGQEKLPGTG